MTIPMGQPFLYPLDKSLRPVASPISCVVHPFAETGDPRKSKEEGPTPLDDLFASASFDDDDQDDTVDGDSILGGSVGGGGFGVGDDFGGSERQASIAQKIAEIRLSNGGGGSGGASSSSKSSSISRPPGCGFQGIFLEDDSMCIESYEKGLAACLDKWAADPAHPPSECLFTPSDDCAVEFY